MQCVYLLLELPSDSGVGFDLNEIKVELVSDHEQQNTEPKTVKKKHNTRKRQKKSKTVKVSFIGRKQGKQEAKIPVPCPLCDKIFPSHSQMKKHERGVHTPSEFPCQYCGKVYKRRYDLVDHERRHTGVRPFSCDTCGKSFFSKHNLRTHEHLHKTKGSYQCQYCGRYFDSKGGMEYHERTHTGEKPYQCKYCEKRFGHTSMLIIHQRIHTGEKPYSCRYCPKSFCDHSTLRKHIRIHTLEKPYKCDQCDKAYNQRWCLRTHLKQHLADGSLAPRVTRKQKSSKTDKQETPVDKSVDLNFQSDKTQQYVDQTGSKSPEESAQSANDQPVSSVNNEVPVVNNRTPENTGDILPAHSHYQQQHSVASNCDSQSMYYSNHLPSLIPMYGTGTATISHITEAHKGYENSM